MAERVGQQLGNYRLVSLLGEGGFAEVYLGEHVHLGTQAAIKVLHAQLTSNEMEQFRLEARTIAHLEHPHIVRILDFGIEGKIPFLVMSYAPNGTLRQRHSKGTVVPLMTIALYVKQIADALQYAHDEKLIHRDIKPENILIGRRDEVLLSDFGIALIAQSSRYQSTQDVIGTVAYMAPEQIQGKPRPASDQYALGVVVYEWLCGDRPFHGSFTELCTQHMFASPPPLQQKVSTISPEVEQVVQIALAKDPKQRFVSIKAFATALEQVSESVEFPAPALSSQLLKANAEPISPAQHVWPAVPVTSLSRSPDSNVISISSDKGELTKSGVSRRTVLIGLGGIALVGVAGGITWLARAQNSGVSPVSLNSRQTTTTPTTASTTEPSPHTSPIGTLFLTYRGHSSWVQSVAWSLDGKRIASGGGDLTVQIWDTTSGTHTLTYHGHSSWVHSAVWSLDGKHIASGGDYTVQIWDATTGTRVLTYNGHSSWVQSVAWSPNGKYIVSGSDDHTVQVWVAMTGGQVFTYSGHPGGSSGVKSVAWSPDGKYITSGGADNIIQVCDATTGGQILTYRGHSSGVVSVAWSPDGKRIASASSDNTVQVWDAMTGGQILTYRGHSSGVNAATWSPDGKYIASASSDNTAQVWDATTGMSVLTYSGHSDIVLVVAWSPDGKRIASGSNDHTVQVWGAIDGGHV